MLILVAGLFLTFLPFLVFMGPIIVWAALPLIAVLTAISGVNAIQRRRRGPALAHQH